MVSVRNCLLKVSQKIDSFMSSLGINVGHTGGSMLAEAMIAMRGIGVAKIMQVKSAAPAGAPAVVATPL